MKTYGKSPTGQRWQIVAVIGMLTAAVALAQEAPKKITRSEAINAVVSRVTPDYPLVARQLKIQGTVELNATVSETGEVSAVQIVSGNPVLTAPSVQAVKRWKFKPFVEDGKPIRVLAPISVDYKL